MSPLNRRGFLKLAGATGAVAAATAAAPAVASPAARKVTDGLLIDTTKCVGCRACEAACTEVNHQPAPDQAGDRSVFDGQRKLGVGRYTVVNRVEGARDAEGKDRFFKRQCMHCLEPACASACLARALEKQPEGPITYDKDRCIGCRYCMVACPFEVPQFDYSSNAPTINKCQFCFERQKEGDAPACASVCPSGALTFGRRDKLLELAKQRVYQNPDRYVGHVYGEHEAGGTSVLYISDQPFEKLGLPTDLGNDSWPELTSGALGVVPFIMTLWPPLLMGIHHFTERAKKAGAEPHDPGGDDHHG